MAKRAAPSFLQVHVPERFPDPLNPPPVRPGSFLIVSRIVKAAWPMTIESPTFTESRVQPTRFNSMRLGISTAHVTLSTST